MDESKEEEEEAPCRLVTWTRLFLLDVNASVVEQNVLRSINRVSDYIHRHNLMKRITINLKSKHKNIILTLATTVLDEFSTFIFCRHQKNR